MKRKQLWSKRILAFMLSVVMVFGTADNSAFAVEADMQVVEEESVSEEATEEIREIPVSSAVKEEAMVSESVSEDVFESEAAETEEIEETTRTEEASETEEMTETEETGEVEESEQLEPEVVLTVSDNIDSGTVNNISWVIDKDGKLTISGSGDYYEADGLGSNMPWSSPWYRHRDKITSAEVRVTGMTDMSYMFQDCTVLTQVDLSGFSSDNLKRTNGMFDGCESLASVDLSMLQTENVIYMGSMFQNCSNLKSVKFGTFQTGNVRDMSFMFRGCTSLTSLDLSTFQTGNVTDMMCMFNGCKSLASLDLNTFQTENVTDMLGMFSGCEQMAEVKLDGFDVSNVTNMESMFSECRALSRLDLSHFYTEKVTDMSRMFYDCEKLTDLKVGKFQTENVTSVSNMFQDCKNLTELDLSSFDMTNVQFMSYMFSGCEKLATLTMGDFNTENATTMEHMFTDCSSLTELDLSSFHTEKVTDMSLMFNTCSSLKSLDLRGFNTKKVTDMNEMFSGCSSLTTLDLSGFDMSGLKDDTSLCFLCDALTTIYTPYNLSVTIMLPIEDAMNFEGKDVSWYRDGKVITEFPKKLAYSVRITKGQTAAVTEAYITAAKQKTVYECGDVLNVDDLKVQYYGVDGTVRQITDYTTNQSEIDMSVLGTKELRITYKDGEKDLITTIKLTVKAAAGSNITIDVDDSDYTTDKRTDLSTVGVAIATIKAKVYDGVPYEPIVKVTVTESGKKKTLTEGTDYRVLYENNIKVGKSGKVTVKGNGIYKGAVTASLTITPKSVKKLKIVTGSMTVGDKSAPPICVYDGAKLLTEGTDYSVQYDKNLTQQPTTAAKITVNGLNNYTGSITVKVAVYEGEASKIINPTHVTLSAQKTAYTGKAIKTIVPEVTIGGTTLQPNKDYKVQYQNNKDAGTAYVIVTGKGAYKGKVVKTFEINSIDSDLTVKEIKEKTYNGKLQKPSVAVTANGKKLSKKDYTVIYSQNLHAETKTAQKAQVTVVGKGNYDGAQGHAAFTINPQKIAKVSVKGAQGNLILTYNKRVLKEGTDYTLQYGAVAKNKVEVTITGKGDFTGTVTKKVTAKKDNNKEDNTETEESKTEESKTEESKAENNSETEKDSEKEREINEKLAAVYKQLNLDNLSPIDKIGAIYDYVTAHVAYDHDGESTTRYTLYGALIDGKAVCQGYALLMERMLNDNQLPAQYISGIGLSCSGGPARHAWNIVKYNGVYYNLDATWDCTNGKTREWFMKSQADFEDHVRDDKYDTEAFLAAYPMAKYSYGEEGALPKYENFNYTFSVAGGGTVSTSTAEDKKMTIFVFGRTTCSNTMSFLQSLKEKEFCKDDTIKIVFADVEDGEKDDETTVAAFKKEYGTEKMYFCYNKEDMNSSAMIMYYAERYGSVGKFTLPVVVVVDSKNAVRFIRRYPVSVSSIEQCLERLKEE